MDDPKHIDTSDLREDVALMVATMHAEVEEARALRTGINGDLVVLVRDALKDGMDRSQELADARFKAFAAEIKAMVEVQNSRQESCLDAAQNGLETMRIEVDSHNTKIKIQRTDHDSLAAKVQEHEEAIQGLRDAPGKSARKTLGAWKASIITAVGLVFLEGVAEGIKYLLAQVQHGKHP